MNILGWLLLLLIPFILILFLRRGTPRIYAIRQVIRIFLKSKALDPESAMFQEELGFKQEKHSGNQFISFLFTGWGLREDEIQRDAVRYLMKDGIILSTPEGRLYLSESKLKASGFNRGTS